MQIELLRSEVRYYSPDRPFNTLNFQEQARLASIILRHRNDANSQKIAFYIELGNPNFRDFVVVDPVRTMESAIRT